MIELVVAYDIETVTRTGPARLARVADICEMFGQRVQDSVFECVLSPADVARLVETLRGAIDHAKDSVRAYRIAEPRDRHHWTLGRTPRLDIRRPIIV